MVLFQLTCTIIMTNISSAVSMHKYLLCELIWYKNNCSEKLIIEAIFIKPFSQVRFLYWKKEAMVIKNVLKIWLCFSQESKFSLKTCPSLYSLIYRLSLLLSGETYLFQIFIENRITILKVSIITNTTFVADQASNI